jgi:hypothetical protein
MKKAKNAKGMKKTPSARRGRMAKAAKRISAFYKHPKKWSFATGNSIGEEFASAARAADAVAGLRRFLKKYQPPDDEYQDAFHRNHVRAAQYELMRLEYIKGNVKAGDRLLSHLQDIDK